MYVTQSDACNLPNSESPISQAMIDAQNRRIARVGSRFVGGNRAMGRLVSVLTPPVPVSSCDDFQNSLAMDNLSPFPFPDPNPTAVPAASSGYPLSFDDLISAMQAATTPASTATAATSAAASASAAAAAPAGGAGGSSPVSGAHGGRVRSNGRGGLTVCLPKLFQPAAGMSGYQRRRGVAGFGDYEGSPSITLHDGTVVSDPGNTPASASTCLPFQCGADPSNSAARYWCAYWGFSQGPAPCDAGCAAYAPSYCSAPPAAPAPAAPAPAAPGVYPAPQVQSAVAQMVPPRCVSAAPNPYAAGNSDSVCFNLESPVLWGVILALGLGAWAMSGDGRKG